MPPRGVARFKLAISGLPSLVPNEVKVLLCDNLSPDFLIGRKALSNWNLSVHYHNNNRESWHAGDHRVMALSARAATEYNAGFFSERGLAPGEWTRATTVVNPFRMKPDEGWTLVSRRSKGGKLDPPPGKIPPPPKPGETAPRGEVSTTPPTQTCAGGPPTRPPHRRPDRAHRTR